MVKCDKCGQNLTRNVKFCSNCGDAITWPEVDGQSHVNRVDEFVKERGTEIVHDNIPDEYIDKIKENISNYQEIRNDPERSIIDENERLSNAKENVLIASDNIRKSGGDFVSSNEYLNNAKDGILNAADTVKQSGSNFINNNISDDSQEKIKSTTSNLSQSTKDFFGDANEVLSNIQSHRNKVKQQKRQEREVEREIKKAQDEEDRKRNKIFKEELHQKNIIEIRATKTALIEIPRIEETDDVMQGAIKGEMMGSAVGRAAEGLFGNKDSLSSTLNAGLVLGGVGSLLGGLAAAADDGISWSKNKLHIADDEIIISGKYSIPFNEIKLVSTGKFKNHDMIVLTLQDKGFEFKTDDALALKIVIDEYIQKYNSNKKSPGGVDDLLKYADLYERGIITKEELEEKKKDLL